MFEQIELLKSEKPHIKTFINWAKPKKQKKTKIEEILWIVWIISTIAIANLFYH